MSKTIEDIILEKGYYFTKPKGTSMFPLLRENKNDICIVKAEKPLKKFDVALYKRENGVYVLHRVIDINTDGYVCCGDNQWIFEYGVKDEQIVGRLDSWYKGEKKHTVRDASYLKYVKFWCKSIKRRHFILYFCHKCWHIRDAIREIGRKLWKM